MASRENVSAKENNIFYKLRMSCNNGQGVSINELGRILNISPVRIGGLELGHRLPSKSQLEAYHKHFGVSIERLMGLEKIVDVDYIESIPNITGLPIFDVAMAEKNNTDKKNPETDKVSDSEDKKSVGELVDVPDATVFAKLTDILYNTLYGRYVLEQLSRILFYKEDEKENIEDKEHIGVAVDFDLLEQEPKDENKKTKKSREQLYDELKALLFYGERGAYKSLSTMEMLLTLENLFGDE